MTTTWETIVNGSTGKGIIVSLENGKRKEEFLNTDKCWYFAQEYRLYESWAQFELKTPGLGDLVIVLKKYNDKEYFANVAQFPKGTWEFVRLLT